jgi:hypothetical protein
MSRNTNNFTVKNNSIRQSREDVQYALSENLVNSNGWNDSGSISLGYNYQQTGQGQNCISIGNSAGQFFQGDDSIAIGTVSGFLSQGPLAVSIGAEDQSYEGAPFQVGQGFGSVNIGAGSGNLAQGTGSVSIGFNSGEVFQGAYAISIGSQLYGNGSPPAQFGQGDFAISIGASAGSIEQGTGAIAIGYYAGVATQGFASIAIGAGAGDFEQAPHSTCLNATWNDFYCATGGFYVAPVSLHSSDFNINSNSGVGYTGAYAGPTGAYVLSYNMKSSEIFATTNKTFVIDHPVYSERHLVHACVESPHSNLMYNGTSKIEEHQEKVRVQLPSYVAKIGRNFTVNLTCKGKHSNLYTDGVINGEYFDVFGEPDSEFFWNVYGLMGTIDAEPYKNEVNVSGFGPYKYLN